MAATEALICNMALGHIGIAPVIANYRTDLTAEAKSCRTYFEHCRDYLLQQVEWGFARGRVQLQEITGDPPSGWDYAYAYPSRCLKIRKIVNTAARIEGRGQHIPFEIYENEASSARLIACDEYQAVAEYTKAITDVTLFTTLFVEAMSWNLAAQIGAPLRADAGLVKLAAQNAAGWLNAAAAHSNSEGREDELPDSEFVRVR